MPFAFVPYVPTPHSPPSPRAEELGRRLGEAITQYEVQHPDLTGLEVRQALNLALRHSGRGDAAMPGAVLLVVALVTVFFAVGLIGALVERGQGGSPWMAVVLAILGVVAAALIVARLRMR